MLRRFVFAIALGITSGQLTAAPGSGTKPKKEPAVEEKKKGVATDSHKVRRGETLWGLARDHGVSVGDIMDLNHLSDSVLRDGQVLKIPRPGSDPALAPAKATTHTVAKGETFRSIARKYGLTQDDLERANLKTDPDKPKAGSKLTIPATVSIPEQSAPDAGKTKPPGPIHTVTETDTYRVIAKKYGSTEAAIAAANPGVNPDRLRPGSKLNIPPRATRPDDSAGAATSPTDDKPAPKTRRYVVSADETPQTISEAFNIPVKRLYEINGLKPGSPMEAGLEIRVPDLSATEIE